MHIRLSESGIETSLFHDYEYTEPESNRGANADTLTITIENKCGNFLSVDAYDLGDRLTYSNDQGVSRLTFTIHGAIERGDFLSMLELIQKALEVKKLMRG